MQSNLPLLITMGDVAGVGPEIIVRSWKTLQEFSFPVVVGDETWLKKAASRYAPDLKLRGIRTIEEAVFREGTVCFLSDSKADLGSVQECRVNAQAGQGAYDFLCQAIDLTMQKRASAIVTAPLHKEGLYAAGIHYPGHTEILADRTGVREFGMVLAIPGLAVAHVTLHMALKKVFDHISIQGIVSKGQLLDGLLKRMLGRRPRIAVAALNPHASDGGLFGEEEEKIIAPAVEEIQKKGIDISGPIACDTLFVRAKNGEFDGVVAMYHDQGHIALKLSGLGMAVNISIGLPIIRTSVAHGTAYDIAWQGKADPSGMVEAARIASKLAGAE